MTRPTPIYLDYAATTPLDPRVAELMHQAMLVACANPASQHRAGREARKSLQVLRDTITLILGGNVEGMECDQFVFTSGGTEANNLALLGRIESVSHRLLISAVEHSSITGPAEEAARRGARVETIGVDRNGVVDLDHAQRMLDESSGPTTVSVMLANNETGVVQPVRELAELCRDRDVLMHTDAVQYAGKSTIHFQDLGVAALTVSAHKLRGPIGIGGLLLRHDVHFHPQMFGGFQQAGLRPGTESLLLVRGFVKAMDLAANPKRWQAIVPPLRDAFEMGLCSQLDNLVINGESAPRLPHISNIAFLGVDRQQLFLALDFAGVYCSTGSACASGSSEPSPVLRAMGLPEAVISSSLRFSFGAATTRDEVDEAVERIVKCVKELRSRKSVRK